MKLGSKRILIVDPDREAARELAFFLGEEGYDAETSDSISTMAERIRDARFDCVIMDVDLPEMPGHKAVSIVKTIDPKVQVIMTAASNTADLEAEVRRHDIFYYYIKSFDREELLAAVADVFKKAGKVRQARPVNEPANILVVDDDVNFVAVMKPVLQSKGYNVDAAHNKAEAMKKLEGFTPDLILLDIMMEKLTDGFDICYKLKHDPQTKKIPVLAVSSITAETGFKVSSAVEGEYFEADDFLQKPVEPLTLLGRIEKLLER